MTGGFGNLGGPVRGDNGARTSWGMEIVLCEVALKQDGLWDWIQSPI